MDYSRLRLITEQLKEDYLDSFDFSPLYVFFYIWASFFRGGGFVVYFSHCFSFYSFLRIVIDIFLPLLQCFSFKVNTCFVSLFVSTFLLIVLKDYIHISFIFIYFFQIYSCCFLIYFTLLHFPS